MTRFAEAPCIICGKTLRNVEETATNQPYEGTAFSTHGHYGSTAFDPMNGEFLEITVCDSCLREVARQKRVLIGRSDKPVTIEGVMVGWTLAYRALVHWQPEMEPDEDTLTLDTEDEWDACKDKVRLTPGGESFVLHRGWKLDSPAERLCPTCSEPISQGVTAATVACPDFERFHKGSDVRRA